MLNKIKQLYKKEQFHPSLLALFLNPFYFARKGLLHAISKRGDSIVGKTLDIGCGQKPYVSLFNSTQYIGLAIRLLAT